MRQQRFAIHRKEINGGVWIVAPFLVEGDEYHAELEAVCSDEPASN